MKYVCDRLTDLIEQILIKKVETNEIVTIPCTSMKEAITLRVAIYKHAKRLRVDAHEKGYSNKLIVSASDLLIRLVGEYDLQILDRSSLMGVSALERALEGYKPSVEECSAELNLLKQWQSENIEVEEEVDNSIKLEQLGIKNNELDEKKLNQSNPYYSKD